MALYMTPDGSVYDIPPEALEAFKLWREPAGGPGAGMDAFDPDEDEEAALRIAGRGLSEREMEEVETALRQFTRILGEP